MANISIAGDATSSPIGLTYKLKQIGYIQKNTNLGGKYSSTMNTVMAGGKKKGMHWKTYHRKYEQYEKLRRATDAVFFRQAYKLKTLNHHK